MNSQEEALKRRIPIPLLMCNMALKILHSGMTAKEILELGPVDFGKFIGQACQMTADPCFNPYERDFVPGVMISMTGSIKLGARSTENMVRTPPTSPFSSVTRKK